MHVTALFRFDSSGPVPKAALRGLLRAARTGRLAGFRRWQTFRALGSEDLVLALVDWDSEAHLRAALADPELARLLERALEWYPGAPSLEILPTTFDRRLSRQAVSSTLLRLAEPVDGHPRAGAPGRAGQQDRSLLGHMALQALAAPGTTRIYGAEGRDSGTSLCRIDFDTDDGIWHFLESPLRKSWTARAEQAREREVWALNLPRLEYARASLRSAMPARQPRSTGGLSIQFAVSDDHLSGQIWLQGRVDGPGSAWCERLCGLLLEDGCRRLEVDVSGLLTISADALGMLTRTARNLKARGGEFVLTDNEERVKRVTRSRHLLTSVR